MNNGHMSALLVNLDASALLMKNVSANGNHWLTLSLRGTISNRDGMGARVTVVSGGRTQIAERVAASGYLSQDDGRLHFGLGTVGKVEEVRVRWPSGKEQTLKDVAVDRVLLVEEPR
jgi:hypothetical protein